MYVNAINRIYITLEYAQFECYTPVTYTLRNTVKNDQLAQYTNKINLTRTRSIVEVGQHREFDNGKNIWANRTLESIEPGTVMHFPITI